MLQRKDITIVLISDTHGYENDLDIPASDVLIHSGDWTTQTASAEPTLRFSRWLGTLPRKHKVVIPGNHEWAVVDPSNRSLITHATLLINKAVTVEGLKIWGSPVTPLYGGAFGMLSEADRPRL